MGTNYYLRFSDKVFENSNNFFLRKKDDIKRKMELHIGKCSAGWRFLFHQEEIENNVIDTYGKWKDLINQEEYEVWDEYDILVNKEELFDMIDKKQVDTLSEGHSTSYYGHFISKDGYDFCRGEFS